MGFSVEGGVLILIASGIVFFLDATIVVMGYFNRKKFSLIDPRFFGLMSGQFTEYVVRRFGLGIIGNTLFMLPIYIVTVSWLVIAASLYPSLVQVLVGMAIGFHLAMLLLSLMKLSILAVFEARYTKTFKARVNKAVKCFTEKKI